MEVDNLILKFSRKKILPKEIFKKMKKGDLSYQILKHIGKPL